MLLELVLIIATRLADNAQGVNALLPAVERVNGHVLPPNVTIFNEIDHSWAARGDIPDDVISAGPVIVVSVPIEGDMQAEVPSVYRNGTIPILLRYAAKGGKTAEHVRNSYYTLRAAGRSLANLDDNEDDPARLLNNIKLEGFVQWKPIPAGAFDGTSPVTAGILLFCQMTDNAP